MILAWASPFGLQFQKQISMVDHVLSMHFSHHQQQHMSMLIYLLINI